MSLFEIVFTGQLIPGAQLALVKTNMGRLFQADEQRLALLFSGRRLVLKNNLGSEAAERYRATLERAGASVQVVAMGAAPEPAAVPVPRPAPMVKAATEPAAEHHVEEIMMAPPPDYPGFMHRDGGTPTVAAPMRAQVVPRDVVMAAFKNVDAPDFDIAAVGADLADKAPRVRPPRLDLDQFSLAPAGADMGQAKINVQRPVPDTSHLKIIG